MVEGEGRGKEERKSAQTKFKDRSNSCDQKRLIPHKSIIKLNMYENWDEFLFDTKSHLLPREEESFPPLLVTNFT